MSQQHHNPTDEPISSVREVHTSAARPRWWRRILMALGTILVVLIAFVVFVLFPRAPAPMAPTPPTDYTGYISTVYSNPTNWLCLPDRDDMCSRGIEAAELRPDGTHIRVEADPASERESVDCFYVYPTMYLDLTPQNVTDFSNLAPIEEKGAMQITPFGQTCRIFAPLYRQATIGAYLFGEERRRAYSRVGASDVVDAFMHYMANENDGRKVVLIGHSQGSEMVINLLQMRFDNDPALRDHLLFAFILGGSVEVPRNQTTGGTFQNIPICTQAGEIGCVIAYRSYPVDATNIKPDMRYPEPEGHEEVCVNPAALDDPALSPEDRRTARIVLQGSLLPPPGLVTDEIRDPGVGTPFVVVRGAYSGACADGPDPGIRYYAIQEETTSDDPRDDLVHLSSQALRSEVGLHALDFQFPMEEFVSLVRARLPESGIS